MKPKPCPLKPNKKKTPVEATEEKVVDVLTSIKGKLHGSQTEKRFFRFVAACDWSHVQCA